MKLFVILFVFFHPFVTSNLIASSRDINELIDVGIRYANNNNFQLCIEYMNEVLTIDSNNFEAKQVLGSAYVKLNNELGLTYLQSALDLCNWNNSKIIANYVEALRVFGYNQNAYEVVEKYIKIFSNESFLYFNYATLEHNNGNHEHALELYISGLNINPNYIPAWHACGKILNTMNTPYALQESENLMRQALRIHSSSAIINYILGESLQMQNKLDEALHYLRIAYELYPSDYHTNAHLATTYHVLGKANEALFHYEKAMPFYDLDAGIRNNYGALLGTLNKKEEEVYWLQEALKIDPNMTHALVNLVGYYQDEGILPKAVEYLSKAISLEPGNHMLALRKALIMSPVLISWRDMIKERNAATAAVLNHNSHLRKNPITKMALDSSLDRIHFYVVYHGVNDRYLQELIIEAYHLLLKNIDFLSPSLWNYQQQQFAALKSSYPLISTLDLFQIQIRPALLQAGSSLSYPTKGQGQLLYTPPRKIRIGFISKFFGIFEPHAMLLDGIMNYLPRNQYTIIVLPVARTDVKPIHPTLVDSSDMIVEISLQSEHALQILSGLQLDILVFADTMSEPITHFLAHSRVASVQVAFWGNPITSGSKNIDFFVSADVLEHPYRTRMAYSDEPYTEQVVLLEGQGIWYYKPEDPHVTLAKAKFNMPLWPDKNFTRSEFGLQDDWFIFFLPQSVFKIHPLYDIVLLKIAMGVPNGHILVTGGRRTRWTDVYFHRLSKVFALSNVRDRIHVIPRVSSEKFLALLNISDVILHPFPFDGSRTSADAIIAGVPMVTLPTEYCRGRMGHAFFKTMNMPELVARDLTEYVDISIQLAVNKTFYDVTKKKIIDNRYLIWEDMETIFAWTQFLSGVSGLPSISWSKFLKSTSLDYEKETALYEKRRRNRDEFDKVWGSESWLLNGRGQAVLETFLDDTTVPYIFNNWNKKPSDIFRLNQQVQALLDSDPFLDDDKRAALKKPMMAHVNQNDIRTGSEADRRTGPSHPNDHLVSSKSISSSQQMSQTEEFLRMRRVDEYSLDLISKYVKKGQFDDAYSLALGLMPRHEHDPLFLLNFGAIQFFRSEYDQAFQYCAQAAMLAPDATMAHGCVGVSGVYLNRKDETLVALTTAWNLMNSKKLKTMNNNNDSLLTDDLFRSNIFGLTQEALEFNLITALNSFKEYENCLNVVSTILTIPSIDFKSSYLWSAYVLIFSIVHWSDHKMEILNQYGVKLTNENISLYDEIQRIQTNYHHILNPIMECLMNFLPIDIKNHITTEMLQFIELSNINPLDSTEFQAIIESSRLLLTQANDDINQRDYYDDHHHVVLITQHFLTENPYVQHDMIDALTHNLEHPFISKIFSLNEEILNFNDFPFHWKLKQVDIQKRLTFQEAFRFANKYLVNKTVILANADIYFDDTLYRLYNASHMNFNKTVFALLKWTKQLQSNDNNDNGMNNPMIMQLRSDSQDAWIFQPPIPQDIIDQSDFALGLARCDNRIADIFSSAGYEVINPALAIHAIEIHSSQRQGKLYATKGSVLGKSKDVLISDQHVF